MKNNKKPFDESSADQNTHPESFMMASGSNLACLESIKLPLFLTSTFKLPNAKTAEKLFAIAYGKKRAKQREENSGLIYARLNEPNLAVVENQLTIYEKGAEDCAFFASGLASITTTIFTFLNLKPNGVILAGRPIYGGTNHFLETMLEPGKVIFFDNHMNQYDIEKLLTDNPSKELSMIFIETPANPTNAIFDIKMLSKIAKKYSTSENKAILVVDNTYLGPIFQHPITLGADLVVYSATKYIGGHSDLIAGACLGSKELISKIKTTRTFLGNMADPMTCWLVSRSLETLHLRMKNQAKNAKKIAKYLSTHPMVEKIYYLGNLNSKKTEKIVERQCSSFGAMIAFDIAGTKKQAFTFLDSLKIIKLAVSLGGNESLAEHPYTMTHADMEKKLKERLGITTKMIRLSVGNEHYKDLIADIGQALEKAKNN